MDGSTVERALAVLVDVQSSVPRTHKWLTDVCNTSFRIFNDLFWPLPARGKRNTRTHF